MAKKKFRINYRYDVVNPSGQLEPWSGSWKTPEEANEWYNTHGKWWEKEGRIIKRIETKIEIQ